MADYQCRSLPPYPEDPRDIRTFDDLFFAYLLEWPAAFSADAGFRWRYLDEYSTHLLSLARDVAREYPETDLWDVLEPALRGAMKGYDAAKKATFDWLFERTLRERFRKHRARTVERACRRQAAEQAYAKVDAQGERVAESTFRRWLEVMLKAAAGPHLDPDARSYLEMRWADAPVAAIAQALGTTERAVNNRFAGKDKLRRVVQTAIRRAVMALPADDRGFLVRYLKDGAGLSATDVESLLGMAVEVDDRVPLLDEDALLAKLGWAAELSAKDYGRAGAFVSTS